MSTSLDALVAKIRAKRSEKLPQAKSRLEKLKAARQAVQNAQMEAAAAAGSDSELQARLREVDYARSLRLLDNAILSSENAVNRLQRTSINIGVAGKSGQGKSQILQMLTGLTDRQIPTGGGGACTAARSIVHNGTVTSARVHYLTKDALLEKKVYPSYAAVDGKNRFALGLSPRPSSLEGFLQMTLPSVGVESGTTEAVDNWQKVVELQLVLREHPELFVKLGIDSETVDISKVRDYIVKDNGETLHNVVDFVEITTPFSVGLPEGLTVYDLPGLADPTPGIREDMLASLKSDADIVLFLRKASPDGERELWKPEDNDATDLMKSVYSVEDVQPADWIQLILNRDSRTGHVNERNTETLRKTVTKGFVPVICDCGKADAVRQMVEDNIERLVGNVARIDDVRIAQADQAFEAASSAVRSVADAVAAAVGQTIAQSSGFDYDGHEEQFWADLRAPFKMPIEQQLAGMQEKLKASLKSAFSGAYAKMKHIYEAYEQHPDTEFPPEFPVFSKPQLVKFLRGDRGTKGAIDRAAWNQLSVVVELLRNELKGHCEELRNIYLRAVVESVTKDNAAIQALIRTGSEQDGASPEGVFKTLKNRLEEGADSVETLVAALENLLHFDVSYETQLLPYLFDVPELSDKFDPYAPSSDLGELQRYLDREYAFDFVQQADVLFNALKNYSFNWIAPLANERSEGPCQEVSKGIMRVVKANYRNFIAKFVWGDRTEYEWKHYMRANVATLWPDDFAKASAQSQVGLKLRDIVAKLRRAVQ